MYYTHNLRVKLQNEVNKLYKSPYNHLSDNLRFFLKFISEHSLLRTFLAKAGMGSEDLKEQARFIGKNWNRYEDQCNSFQFADNAQRAVFYYELLNGFLEPGKNVNDFLHYISEAEGWEERKFFFVEEFIHSLTNFLEDQLDEGGSVLYLLEKYKLRTENFLGKELRAKYQNASSGYEQVLDDDLRLYLFDQGIDHPFSTPKSASGRADIVCGINTSDPLILEIKVFDLERQYGKDRIRDGFIQALKYARDYNKNVAYVAVFVMDDVEIELTAAEDAKNWPHRISYNNCYFHFVFIYLNQDTTASKSKTRKVRVSLEDLIKEQ